MELRRLLAKEQSESTMVRERLAATKRKLATVKSRMLGDTATVRKHAAARVEQARAMAEEWRLEEQALKARMTAQQQEYQKQLAEVMRNNQRLVKSASDMVYTIPKALRQKAKGQLTTEVSATEIRRQEGQKAVEAVATVKASHQVELAALHANHR